MIKTRLAIIERLLQLTFELPSYFLRILRLDSFQHLSLLIYAKLDS